LETGFIDHLYTSPGTTSNYSVIANLHTLQITTASDKPFSSLLCLHQPFLATASNSGDSSASRAQVLSSRPPAQTSTLNRQLSTRLSILNWVAPIVFLMTTLHGSSRKRRFQQKCHFMFVFFAAGTCLPIRCLATGCITPLFICLLHSKCCTCYYIHREKSFIHIPVAPFRAQGICETFCFTSVS
jgi:hypothetical protein